VNALDQLSLLALFVICVLSQVLFIEFGFRYGHYRREHGVKAQLAQVRAIMGASLGLLAFMLAFAFSIAQQHFEARTQAYMLEVSAIDSAYRGSDLLEEEPRLLAKDLLKRFAVLRLDTVQAVQAGDRSEVVAMVRESERIHDLLWGIAESAMEGEGNVADSGIFAQSVLTMISAHDARLQAAIFNRISPVIWLTLYIMALLSMLVMGYQAGLTGTRSSLATWSLALAFSVVMALITDLDRPNMSLFNLDQGLMEELESRMEHQGIAAQESLQP
jgi:hypothetical protein